MGDILAIQGPGAEAKADEEHMSTAEDYPVLIDSAEDAFSEAIGLECFSYSGQVTEDVFNVFRLIAESDNTIPSLCTDDIAGRLNMVPSHVELIQYIICNRDHAEYGTSPRCCWLTDKGRALWATVSEMRSKGEGE